MVQPVQNINCDPRFYGGFDHTLFLGCSVMSFSASAGLNEQVTEITVQLVEDICDAPIGSPKKYYNCDLEIANWTGPDPGFFGLISDIIGAPVFFRVGLFEFCGIIQAWEQNNSTSGNPTYQVKLVSPNFLLSNAQIIINDYAGGVGTTYNAFNVFGYRETFGGDCGMISQDPRFPSGGTYELTETIITAVGSDGIDGAVFGSPAQKFGGADVNNNGMQWEQILKAIKALTSSLDVLKDPVTNMWSPYGRLVYRSHDIVVASINCMGLLPFDDDLGSNHALYYLDLSEVPTAPSYWRLNGTNTSIMDAVSQIVKDAGYDYYVELLVAIDPIPLGAGIHKFIKVRVIDRNPIRSLGQVQTYVDDYEALTPTSMQAISYREGRELRDESTQALVIGGPKQSFYQGPQNTDPEGDGEPTPPTADDLITPYFGLDTNNDIIVPELDGDNFWFFDAPSLDLQLQLSATRYSRAIPSTIQINEKELIAASSSQVAWSSYASTQNTPLWQALVLNLSGQFDQSHQIELIVELYANGDQLRAPDLMSIRDKSWRPINASEQDVEIMEIAYTWIKKFSDDYGKKFMVRVPYTCGKMDTESTFQATGARGIILTSEQPSDGGWTEFNTPNTTVLQLDHPSLYTDFFTLSDNRLGAFCKYDNADSLESINLDVNDFVTKVVDGDDKVWIKVGVEDEYVYLDKSTLFSPRAVITLPHAITEIEQNAGDFIKQINGIENIQTNFSTNAVDKAKVRAKVKEAFESAGGSPLQLGMQSKMIMPDAVGFGIKSNILTYGPWGAGAIAGGVEVKQDDGLVPWEYGGFDNLDLAGEALANEGITNNQVEDAGSVTLPGYPLVPVGAELRSSIDASGPYFNGLGVNLVENRVSLLEVVDSINTYSLPMYSWVGTFGPNVTNLTCEVGPNGIQTTYQLRTWTPKFGKFARNNAQRIKQVGQQQLAYGKNLRAFSLQRLKSQYGGSLNQLATKDKKFGVIINEDVRGKANTPHEVFVGNTMPWNSGEFVRPVVVSESIFDLSTDINNAYDKKAIMSLDGLLRPVSMDGAGGLPRYFQYATGCQATLSRGATPPLDKEGEGGQYNQYNQPHTLDHLNPLTNPTGSRSTITTELSDSELGHDIEIIGRGTGIPASSMVMPIEGYTKTKDLSKSDYADDYRFMALRGPLILQSFGYDLDGFPVPNKVDTAGNAVNGVFADSNLEMKFLDNHLRKSETWPVAPVDLRLDRERGVWTIPQLRNLLVEFKADIEAGSTGLAKVIDGPTLYDTSGNIITNPEINVKDVINIPGGLGSGDKAIVYYDTYECEYRILSTVAGSGSEVFRFRIDEDICLDFDQDVGGKRAAGTRLQTVTGVPTSTDPCGSTTDRCPVILCASILDQWGPAQSGFQGWAKLVGPTGTGAVGDDDGCGTAEVIWMEKVARYIKFSTTENFGCNIDSCHNSSIQDNSANVTVLQSWDGKEPTGDFVVFDTKSPCYEGYKDCGGPTETYKGIAVFDEIRTSISQCDTPSCKGKWVYQVVEINSLRAKDVRDSGCFDYDGSWEGNSIYSFGFGEGIVASGRKNTLEQTCGVNLRVGLSGANNSTCYAYDSMMDPLFSKMFFGGGVTYSGIDDCTIGISAGTTVANVSECYNFDTFPSLVGPRLYNSFKFGQGIIAVGINDENCSIGISAGIEIGISTETCYQGGGFQVGELYSDITLGKGLDGFSSGNDCIAGISAGIYLYKNPICVTGNLPASPSYSKIFNTFNLGSGLTANTGTSCAASLDAGIMVRFDNQLLNTGGANSQRPFNTVVIGSGLSGVFVNDCTVEIRASGGVSFQLLETADECIEGSVNNIPSIEYLQAVNGIVLNNSAGDGTTLKIGAGTQVENNTNCYNVFGEGTLPINADRLYNQFLFGKGIQAVGINGPGSGCHLGISAGVSFSIDETCYKVPNFTTDRVYSNLVLGAGMHGAPIPGSGTCFAGLSAGITFYKLGFLDPKCELGNLLTSTPSSTSHFNLFGMGSGLMAQTGAGCNAYLDAGIIVIDSDNQILNADGANSQRPFNTILLGSGLSGEKISDCVVELSSTGNCATILDAANECIQNNITTDICITKIQPVKGIVLDNSAGSNDVLKIGAGSRFRKADTCTTTSGNLQVSFQEVDAHLYSDITLNKGLVGLTGAGCEISLMAGALVVNNTTCYQNSFVGVDLVDEQLYNKFYYGKGISITGITSEPCSIGIMAGVNISNNTTCYAKALFAKKDINSSSLYNYLKLGRGLFASEISTGPEDCSAFITAGITFAKSDACTTGNLVASIPLDSSLIFNMFNIGSGLAVNTGDDCSAYMDAGIIVRDSSGNALNSEQRPFNTLTLGSGLSGEKISDCNIKISAPDCLNIASYSDTCLTASSITPGSCVQKLQPTKGIFIDNTDTPGTAKIMAGALVVSNSNCYAIEGGGAIDGDQLYNRFYYGKGIAVVSVDQCSVGISAGVLFSDTTTCYNYGSPVSELCSSVTLGAGLSATTIGDCSLGMSAGITLKKTNPCDIGNLTASASKILNEFNLGSGLTANTGAGCTATLDAGIMVTFDGPLNADPQRPFNTMIIGSGLSGELKSNCTFEISLSGTSGTLELLADIDECIQESNVVVGKKIAKIQAANGIVLDNSAGDNNTLKIGAGIQVTENNTCYNTPSLTQDLNATYLYNDFLFGKGIHAYGILGQPCQVGLVAGLQVTNNLLCFKGVGSDVVADRVYSDFTFGAGFCVRQDPDECDIKMNAGIYFKRNITTCEIGNIVQDFGTACSLFNKFNLGSGLTANTGYDCEATLDAGVMIIDSSGTILNIGESSSQRPFNTITLGSGISGERIGDCNVKISSTNDCLNVMSYTDECIPEDTVPDKCIKNIQAGHGVCFDNSAGDNSILKVGAGLRVAALAGCAVTTILTEKEVDPECRPDIYFGSGLNADITTDCETKIVAGIHPRKITDCHVTGGTPLGASFTNQVRNKLSIGGGLAAEFAAGDACDLRISAGNKVTDNTTCYESTAGTQGLNTDRLYNSFLFGKGIKITGIAGEDCSVGISAGIQISDTIVCYNGAGFPKSPLTANRVYGDINLGKGLFATEIGFSSNECSAFVSAGITFFKDPQCDIGNLGASAPTDSSSLYNTFNLGSGLTANTGDECSATLDAGIIIRDSSGNVLNTDEDPAGSKRPFNTIILGSGISGEKISDCSVKLSANVSGTCLQTLSYSDSCIFEDTVPGNCITKIQSMNGICLNNNAGDFSTLQIGAGLRIAASASCAVGSILTSTVFDTQCRPNIRFGKGLNVDITTDCEATIVAGVQARSLPTSCDSAGTDLPTTFTTQPVKNKLTFLKGLDARLNAGDACDILINAGFNIKRPSVSNTCLSDTASNIPENDTFSTEKFSQISFHQGIHAVANASECSIQLGAGFLVEDNFECIDGDPAPIAGQYYNDLIIGRGLRAEGDPTFPCVMKVGLQLEIGATGTSATGASSTQNIARLEAATCLKLYVPDPQQPCVGEISIDRGVDVINCDYVGESGGEGFCAVTVMTGVEYLGCVVCCECCNEPPSGTGTGTGNPTGTLGTGTLSPFFINIKDYPDDWSVTGLGTGTALIDNRTITRVGFGLQEAELQEDSLVLGGVGEFDKFIPYVMTHYNSEGETYIPTHDEITTQPLLPDGPIAKAQAKCECYIYAKFGLVDLNFNGCGLFMGKSNERFRVFNVPPNTCAGSGVPTGDCNPQGSGASGLNTGCVE